MEEKPLLILASSSPRRQELIRSLGLPVRIRPSDVDETIEGELAPADIVETLADRKASAVYDGLVREGERAGIVVGSDTIVVLDGQVLGKPVNERDAARMLSALQGRDHEVYSGVALIDAESGEKAVSHRVTRVWMKPMDEETIRRYITTGEPNDKAGSYAIQGIGATLVERIEGDYFNVVGLPLALVSDMLKAFGVRIL
ncbi:Maf family protein [Paenibacillus thermotolerans]|uniref:Maf family protein n=1 Tax=Paenibacillus thermotolerans TaxID=3027807 RepID=UPI002368928F|nr:MULTISPECIES: Maf family protein [unclassified Paenibacillus]